MENLPSESLKLVDEAKNCNTPCNGDTAYFCGGSEAVDIYVASKLILT